MFKGISILEFTDQFRTDLDCRKYLSQVKWQGGYCCVKCGHEGWRKTTRAYERKCNRCKHRESTTAGTLFHKCKFSLRKAFIIVYWMSTTKKGVSSYELARQLELRQKSCWAFQKKVRQAMRSSQKFPLKKQVVVD